MRSWLRPRRAHMGRSDTVVCAVFLLGGRWLTALVAPRRVPEQRPKHKEAWVSCCLSLVICKMKCMHPLCTQRL